FAGFHHLKWTGSVLNESPVSACQVIWVNSQYGMMFITNKFGRYSLWGTWSVKIISIALNDFILCWQGSIGLRSSIFRLRRLWPGTLSSLTRCGTWITICIPSSFALTPGITGNG